MFSTFERKKIVISDFGKGLKHGLRKYNTININLNDYIFKQFL